ncbi:MAG: hypothetical protein HKN12_07925 [Gemmatimonadetes bacterium]|nr:hypothetical protein [Gemmatimonadota bacterium]
MRALLLRQTGGDEAALPRLDAAIETLAATGTFRELTHALVERAALHERAGRGDAAAADREQVQVIQREHGMVPADLPWVEAAGA